MDENLFENSSCRNFVRAILLEFLLLVVEIKRSRRRRGGDGFRVIGHVPGFSDIDRENQDALVLIACLRMLITFLLKTKTRIRSVHAHHLCQCPFFSILSSTLAEWDENQNKRALPPPKAAKHSLKYILKVLFRKPGNRNLTFIPRGNNTTPFQTFVQHDSTPKILLFPWNSSILL